MDFRKAVPGTPDGNLLQLLGGQLRSLFRKQAVLAGCFLVLALVSGGDGRGAVLGTAAGLSDTFLVLWGIHRGMRKEPGKAALAMHRTMFCRIAVLLCWTLLALRYRWQPVLVMAGFLILNVGLIIQMARCRLGCREPWISRVSDKK